MKLSRVLAVLLLMAPLAAAHAQASALPRPSRVVIVNVPPGETQQFVMTAPTPGGLTLGIPTTWSATGGTISPSGLYTAGLMAGVFTVRATATGLSFTDSAIVTIPAPTLTALAISPKVVTVQPGQTVQFTTTGTWSDGTTSILAPIAPVALAVYLQPIGGSSAAAFPVQPIVELRDANNNAVASSGVVVTVAIGNAGGAGALTGTLTAITNAQGRAFFAGLRLSAAGPYTLTFSSPGLTSIASGTFTVTP